MVKSFDNELSENRDEGIPSKMTQDFLRFYSLHQRQIHAFIGSFFRDSADIDEVLQETSIVLWNKFIDFKPNGNFLSWACGIARFEVLRHFRTKKRKSSALPLDEQLVELLAKERETLNADFDSRHEALKYCLEKLRQQDRQLVEDCYRHNMVIKTVADQINRPVNAVYQSLSRIRKFLHDCINKSLARNEL